MLLVDQGTGEGFSGSPVLQGGRIVGVVTDTDDQTTYAVNALVAREAVEGWGVRLGGKSSTPVSTATQTKPVAPVLEPCVSGEERTEAGIVFVRICPGTFTMGSAKDDPEANNDEKPAHQVKLSEFWIGKTEITNEQYRGFRRLTALRLVASPADGGCLQRRVALPGACPPKRRFAVPVACTTVS